MNAIISKPLQALLEQAEKGACYDNTKQTEPSTYCDGFIKAEVLHKAKAEYAQLLIVAQAALRVGIGRTEAEQQATWHKLGTELLTLQNLQKGISTNA